MPQSSLPAGESLGAALRAARESAGLTVEDVSADTRIRGTLIRDLESDRFESSGAPVYARGHVRAITHTIGVDAAPYLDLFAQQVGGIDEPFPIPTPPPVIPAAKGPLAPPEPLHVPTAARPERRGPNWFAGGSVALGVLVILFVVGQLSEPTASSPPERFGVTGSPTASPSAKPVPAKVLTAARPSGAALTVRIAGGSSWVSVRTPTKLLFEGVLRAGATREFKDPASLRLVVGNAGAVNLNCSGRPLAPAGARGAVLTFLCSPRGIPSAKPVPAKVLTAARPSGAALTVRIAGGNSWVSVRTPTKLLFEGVLRAGASREFKDPASLRLVVGNAGAVNLNCSGRRLAPAGARGAVLTFLCSPTGIVRA